jgi:hypothetical protein
VTGPACPALGARLPGLAGAGRRGLLIAGLGLATACVSSGSRDGLRPFTSDGCSLFPDRALVGTADWCACCLAHDLAYWRGGTVEQRLAADRQFQSCVAAQTGDAALAATMYAGVRAGGGPEVNTPFRWGYGWPHGRGYTALSSAEAAAADRLEAEHRARRGPDACGQAPAAPSAGSGPPAAG